MTGPNVIGREPVRVVALRQPRCGLTFGVAPCTATGTKCYNTFGSCTDRANYDPTATIEWRFTDHTPGLEIDPDLSDPANIKTGGIPCLETVSTSRSEINVGAKLDGKAALGVTGSGTITLNDIPWNDYVGDPYLTDRSGVTAGRILPVRGGLFRMMNARNTIISGWEVDVYEGYVGQTLAQMRKRTHAVEKIDGPNSDGKVTIKYVDPLQLTQGSLFPPPSDLRFRQNVTATATSFLVEGTFSDLTSDIGISSLRYLSSQGEVMAYTGQTDNGDGTFTLTGVLRGRFGTEPRAHTRGDAMQRAGRYDPNAPWVILNDLFVNYTPLKQSQIPLAEWEVEGNDTLVGSRMANTIIEPTKVNELAARIVQQGAFYIWWAEYEGQLNFRAIKPPKPPVPLFNDDDNNLDGTDTRTDAKARITRVTIFYDKISVTGGDSSRNYRDAYQLIDDEVEIATGEIKNTVIFADWLQDRTDAITAAGRLLTAYRETPRFLTLMIDAKDRVSAEVANIIEVVTRYIEGTEGGAESGRWQVMAQEEVTPGHTYKVELQSSNYRGLFGYYAADDDPEYVDATPEQREVIGYYAADDGTIPPDGDEGYQYQ